MKLFPGGFWHMRTKSGHLCFGLLTTCLALLLAIVPPAAAQEDVAADTSSASLPTVVPSAAMIEVGTVNIDADATTAIVPLTVDPGHDSVAAFQLEVVFDAAAMTPTGCTHTSGFGVCALNDDGRLKVNAARIESWSTRTDVVAITFTVDEPGALRIGAVDGVWGDDSNDMQAVDYDTVFGAIHVGEDQAPASDPRPGNTLTGNGAVTGTASQGLHGSTLYGSGVCAVHETRHLARCSVTNSRGEFRIEDLPAGSYTIEYVDDDHKFAADDRHGVIVRDGDTTQGIDFALRDYYVGNTDQVRADEGEPQGSNIDDSIAALSASPSERQGGGGEIVGRVTDSSGLAVAAVLVCVDDIGVGTHVCAASRLDGTYRIAELLGGNYVLSVEDPGQRYVDQSTEPFGFNANSDREIDLRLTSR